MLLVFGATGGTGTALLSHALAGGAAVRAFVRDPGRLTISHPALEPAEGDVLDAAAVEEAVVGAQSVVCLLGLHQASTGDTTVSRGTQNIVAAMERHSVPRLVCQTGFGLGESMRQARWTFRRCVYPFLRPQYADRARQERVVTSSRLDWTIVRPTHLVSRPADGRIQVLTGKARLYDAVSRSDVARQLLAVLPDPTTYRTAITLGAA